MPSCSELIFLAPGRTWCSFDGSGLRVPGTVSLPRLAVGIPTRCGQGAGDRGSPSEHSVGTNARQPRRHRRTTADYGDAMTCIDGRSRSRPIVVDTRSNGLIIPGSWVRAPPAPPVNFQVNSVPLGL